MLPPTPKINENLNISIVLEWGRGWRVLPPTTKIKENVRISIVLEWGCVRQLQRILYFPFFFVFCLEARIHCWEVVREVVRGNSSIRNSFDKT